jgi:hypothetical protein
VTVHPAAVDSQRLPASGDAVDGAPTALSQREDQRREHAHLAVAATVSAILRWARDQRWSTRSGQNEYRVLHALLRMALHLDDETFLLNSRELALEADLSDHKAALSAGRRLQQRGVLSLLVTELDGRRLTTQWQLVPPAVGVCSDCPRVQVVVLEAMSDCEPHEEELDDAPLRGGTEHTLLRPACHTPGAWRDYQGMGALGLLIHQAGGEGLLRNDGQHTLVTVRECVSLFQYERSAAHRALQRLVDTDFARHEAGQPGAAAVYKLFVGRVVEDDEDLRSNPLNGAVREHELQAEQYAYESEHYEMQRQQGFPATARRRDLKRWVLSLHSNGAEEALTRLHDLGGLPALLEAVEAIPGRTESSTQGGPSFRRGTPRGSLEARFQRPERRPLAERRSVRNVVAQGAPVESEASLPPTALPGLAHLLRRVAGADPTDQADVVVMSRIRSDAGGDEVQSASGS